MHTLKKNSKGTFSVGYYNPNGGGFSIIDTKENKEEAIALVSYLNGGISEEDRRRSNETNDWLKESTEPSFDINALTPILGQLTDLLPSALGEEEDDEDDEQEAPTPLEVPTDKPTE